MSTDATTNRALQTGPSRTVDTDQSIETHLRRLWTDHRRRLALSGGAWVLGANTDTLIVAHVLPRKRELLLRRPYLTSQRQELARENNANGRDNSSRRVHLDGT